MLPPAREGAAFIDALAKVTGRRCRGLNRPHRRRHFGRHLGPHGTRSPPICQAAAHRGGDGGLCGGVGDEDLDWHGFRRVGP